MTPRVASTNAVNANKKARTASVIKSICEYNPTRFFGGKLFLNSRTLDIIILERLLQEPVVILRSKGGWYSQNSRDSFSSNSGCESTN